MLNKMLEKSRDRGVSAEEIPKYLILIGLSIVMAGLFVKVLGGLAAGDVTTVAVVNESINCTQTARLNANNSGMTLSGASFFMGIVNSSIGVSNTTDPAINTSGANAVLINILTGAITCNAQANASYNATYNYQYGSEARDTAEQGQDDISNLVEWFDDIGTIFATSVIIGLLLVVWGAYNYYQGRDGKKRI